MECHVKYHIERLLDSKGIQVDILEYKFEDIKSLVQQCRSRDVEDLELGRGLESPQCATVGDPLAKPLVASTIPGPSNVLTTPSQISTGPFASYSGSTACSSRGNLSSSSRDPYTSAEYSPSPLPQGTRVPSPLADATSRLRMTLELPNWSQSTTPLFASGSDTEEDISDCRPPPVKFMDNYN